MDIRQTNQATILERSDNRPKSVKPVVPEVFKAKERQSPAVVNTGNDTAYKEAEAYRAQAEYDKPELSAEKAMDQYLRFERDAKRETVRKMMGVDLYV